MFWEVDQKAAAAGRGHHDEEPVRNVSWITERSVQIGLRTQVADPTRLDRSTGTSPGNTPGIVDGPGNCKRFSV